MSKKMPTTFRFAHQLSTVIAVAASLGCSSVFASGFMSPGSGQGADAYNVGKSVIFKQIACDNLRLCGPRQRCG
jgi:hypothetical protein